MIQVQESDFDQNDEYDALRSSTRTGAIITFVGTVREFAPNTSSSLTLEHYPGMTESVLETIEREAQQRWQLLDTKLIHRIGTLKPGDQIVFVGVASEHRKNAFEACEFLIDTLKTQAPFWKKEGTDWVKAKVSDQVQADKWMKN